MWAIRSFVINGSDVLADWYGEYSGRRYRKAAARLYVAMKYLQQQPYISDWVKSPYFHFLKEADGVGRVGFDVQNIAYRLLGYFPKGGAAFTFLGYAEEHDNVYLPKNCIMEAVNRMKSLESGRATTVEADLSSAGK